MSKEILHLTLLVVQPKTGQYKSVKAAEFEVETEEPARTDFFKNLLVEGAKHSNDVLLIVETPQFNNFLAAKVLASNIEMPKLSGYVFNYALELISKNVELISSILYQEVVENITEAEKEAFSILKTNYDDLVLAKTLFNGIPTVAVCQQIVADENGKATIKPLFIAVNEEIFKLLTPPDEIRNARGEA